jgi:DNA-binding NarL/FixJ family response regulator
MNKQIASQMCLSEITVKIYRREAMKKMGASTVADLVRKAVQLGVQEPAPDDPMQFPLFMKEFVI